MISVVRSLERYGYIVIPIDLGEKNDADTEDNHEMSALERFLQI